MVSLHAFAARHSHRRASAGEPLGRPTPLVDAHGGGEHVGGDLTIGDLVVSELWRVKVPPTSVPLTGGARLTLGPSS